MTIHTGPLRRAACYALAATSLAYACSLHAQAAIDTTKLADDAVARTQEYIRINTTDPPGNEVEAMRFFARIFREEGIPFDTGIAAPGRGNIWARLKGGAGPTLVLLHHMDVVPADRHYWQVDPFAATVKDGFLYGRGTLDTKSLGIAELEAFLAVHRAHTPLAGDLVFIATADEEAGGIYGAGWVAQHHPEAFRGATMLLNEGGMGSIDAGRKQFAIEVTQKTPFWLKLTVTGPAGHGSTPPPASAVNRLIRALYRLQTYEFPPRVVPAVAAYFAAAAASVPERWHAGFANPTAMIADRNALASLQAELPEYAALLRNTCSITMLQGSAKINVVPPVAEAQVDCRLLPDQDHEAFMREFTGALNDPDVKVERIIDFTPAVSANNTPLYNAIVSSVHDYYPEATIVPSVETGFTDSHWFRDLGIASYGFAPFLVPEADQSGVHGNNERLSIDNIRRGTAIIVDIVRRVEGK
jgi:acetylornithine deacetylase/succinyl-diaminopimelate desuccinylase-like protein